MESETATPAAAPCRGLLRYDDHSLQHKALLELVSSDAEQSEQSASALRSSTAGRRHAHRVPRSVHPVEGSARSRPSGGRECQHASEQGW
eukprot:scaffold4779_cov116-Isochrysis_galbana.AAC.7